MRKEEETQLVIGIGIANTRHPSGDDERAKALANNRGSEKEHRKTTRKHKIEEEE